MDKLSGEDRAALEHFAHGLGGIGEAITRALSLIDEYEKALEWQGSVTKALLEAQTRYVKALEAADKLLFEVDGTCLCLGPGHICGICEARNEYKSLRGNNG